MDQPTTQPDSEPVSQYFDPEECDMSEQQFSASLETPVERPRFVLDTQGREEVSATESLISAGCASSAPDDQSSTIEPGASDEPEQKVASISPEIAEALLREAAAVVSEADWRHEVSAKVSSYKSRRPHKERYPSLQLRFEADSRRNAKAIESDSTAAEFSPLAANESSSASYQTLEPEPRILLEATARVLEFPRTAPSPVGGDELADPVMERPRIVEVAELLPPPPAMGGILIESPHEAEAERLPGIDMPLQPAPLARRLWAGAVDVVIVATAAGLFGNIFSRVSGIVLPWRTAAELAAGLIAILWPAYQYAFLVFSEKTPGLRFTGLQVQRFEGGAATRQLRRWRVLASLLSWASLGLGYAWCFLDQDQLSWHDRITKTHLAPAKAGQSFGGMTG